MCNFIAKVINVVYPCKVPNKTEVVKLFLKISILLIVFSGITFQTIGQSSFSSLLKERDNTKKAEIGLELFYKYRTNDFDSLKFLAVNLLLDISGENSDFPRAVGEMAIGTYYVQNGKIKEGIVNLTKAKEHFETAGNLTQTAEVLMEIGNSYFVSGNFEQAIKAYLKSMKIGSRSPDKTLAYAAKMGLGQAYCAIGDTSVGLFTILQFKDEVVKSKKYVSAANAFATLGMIEMDRGNMELSKEYYQKSIEYSKKTSSKLMIANAYTNQAILYFNLNNLDSSLMFFEKALRLRVRLNRTDDIIESYFNLASFYQETEDIDNALYYYGLSVDLAKKGGFNVDEVDALMEMKSIFEERGNTKEIYRIQERIDYLNKFISDRKTMDDEILEYATQLMNEFPEEKKQVNQKSYWFIWLLLGGIVVLLIFGILRRP